VVVACADRISDPLAEGDSVPPEVGESEVVLEILMRSIATDTRGDARVSRRRRWEIRAA